MLLATEITLQMLLALADRGPGAVHSRALEELAAAERLQTEAIGGPRLSLAGRAAGVPGTQVEVPGTGVYVEGTRGLGDPELRARYRVDVAGSMVLWDFGASRLRAEAARARVLSVERREEASRAAADAALAEAFFTWAARVAVQDAAVAELAEVTAAVERARRRVESGQAAVVELERARPAEHVAAIAVARARREVAVALLALERVVGPLPRDAVPGLAGLDEVAGARAEDPAAAAAAAAAAESRLLGAWRRPTLGVEAALGIRGDDDLLFPAWTAGLVLEVPLYDGGRTAGARAATARARAARAAAAAAALRRAADERAAATVVAQAEARVAAAGAWAQLAGEGVLRAEESVRLGGDEEARVAARAELRRAELEVRLARIELASARHAVRNPPP